MKTFLTLSILPCLLLVGCTRSADDRVDAPMPQVDQQSLRSPTSYAIVARRPAPAARISGQVVIIGQGYQAVYAQHGALADVQGTGTSQSLDRLDAIEKQLGRIERKLED